MKEIEKVHLPHGFSELETQVAGHVFDSKRGVFGLIKDVKSGCVLKPLGKPICGERELSFYEMLKTTSDPMLMEVKPLVPYFYDKVNLSIHDKEQPFLKLENVTRSMCQPCIMDIKIGKRTWDPLSTPKKRMEEEEKYSKCKQTLGLCIPGFQVYCLESNKLIRYGKEFGKQLSADKFPEVLELFFNIQTGLYSPLLLEILSHLYKIRHWFNHQTSMKFYASSVLIAYDSQMLASKRSQFTTDSQYIEEKKNIETESNDLPESKWIQVKMIDFAHVFPSDDGCLDTNYIFGINNLINIVENILSDKKQ